MIKEVSPDMLCFENGSINLFSYLYLMVQPLDTGNFSMRYLASGRMVSCFYVKQSFDLIITSKKLPSVLQIRMGMCEG